MSISNGIFTAEDGTEIRLTFITEVTPIIGTGLRAYYNIVHQVGHISVKETYMSRNNFLVAWRAA